MQAEEPLTVKSWEKVKVIGRGGSSTVYKCTVKKTGGFLAVKEIVTDGMNADQIKGIGGEVDTIKNLSHVNIVRCFGSQQQSNKLYIMLEYCNRGSLRKLYQDHGALSEPQAARCITHILHGLEYLHNNGVAHRDVKGANILLSSGGILKLADFGASKKMETESLVSGLKGTPHWMAPEVIKGTQMSTGWMKADVWSLGCTLVEILSASLPFSEYDNPMTAMYQIASGKIPPLPASASPEAVSFVQDCCHADPETRPTVTKLLEHPFIEKCLVLVPAGETGFSEESRLFEKPVPPSSRINHVYDSSADANICIGTPQDLDNDPLSEMTNIDEVMSDHSADVARFMETKIPSAQPRLTVRTTSFRVSESGGMADGDTVPEGALAVLESQETPVMHLTNRKSILTMSNHNILKLSETASTATTPVFGQGRRPPLQITSRDDRGVACSTDAIGSTASTSIGIAHGTAWQRVLSDSSSDIVDDTLEVAHGVMEDVLSPRMTSMTVCALNNPEQRTFFVGSDSDGSISSRADTAILMQQRSSAEFQTTQSYPIENKAESSNLSGMGVSFTQPEKAMKSPLVPLQATVETTPARSSAISEPAPVFQMGSSGATGQEYSTKNHITPVKRKHKTNRRNQQQIVLMKDHHSANRDQALDNKHPRPHGHGDHLHKQPLKAGTINFEGPARQEEIPAHALVATTIESGLDEGNSMEIVLTSSGAQKRKHKATPPGGLHIGAPSKLSTNNNRKVSAGFSIGGANHGNAAVDLVKASTLPAIVVSQHASGLAGKKKESKINTQLIDKVDNGSRPSAPLSSDKLQFSGAVELTSKYTGRDGETSYGNSTGSTTISEACAIAAESNYGKFNGFVEARVKKGNDHSSHNIDIISDSRARHNQPQKLRAKHSARSHSAGIATSNGKLLPLSNNLSNSASRLLPNLRQPGSTGDQDEVLRVIQTAPVVSRLPPIGAPGVMLGSVTPGGKLLNASPERNLLRRPK